MLFPAACSPYPDLHFEHTDLAEAALVDSAAKLSRRFEQLDFSVAALVDLVALVNSSVNHFEQDGDGEGNAPDTRGKSVSPSLQSPCIVNKRHGRRC